MKDLSLFIYESQLASEMLLERNEKMFPRDGQRAKFEIWTGDHCKQRQEERNISDKEIISAFFDAYPQLNKAFKDREFKADRDPAVAGDIVIIDARKDKQTPLTICCWLYKNRADNHLLHSAWSVKTVYRDTGGAKQNRKDRFKVFLY